MTQSMRLPVTVLSKTSENTKNLIKDVLSVHVRMHDCNGILKQDSVSTG